MDQHLDLIFQIANPPVAAVALLRTTRTEAAEEGPGDRKRSGYLCEVSVKI
jgi:hypothetical protein